MNVLFRIFCYYSIIRVKIIEMIKYQTFDRLSQNMLTSRCTPHYCSYVGTIYIGILLSYEKI